MEGLELLLEAHQDLSKYLLARANEDQAYGVRRRNQLLGYVLTKRQSARELAAVMLGEDLAKAVKQCARQLEDTSGEESPSPKLQSYGSKLKDALQDLWKEQTTDVFDSGYEAARAVCCRRH